MTHCKDDPRIGCEPKIVLVHKVGDHSLRKETPIEVTIQMKGG